MEGIILHYNPDDGAGIVKDSEGKRYNFTKEDIKSSLPVRSASKVDFMIVDGSAKEIFSLEGPSAVDDVMEKVASISNNIQMEKAQKVVSGVRNLFESGNHNQSGFITTILLILALFLPIFEIPYAGEGVLIEDWFGKLLFIMLGFCALFYYGGIKKLYTKRLVTLASILVFYQMYDVFSVLSDGTDIMRLFSRRRDFTVFHLLEFGFYAVVILNSVLLYSIHKSSYKENQKSA